MHARGPRLLPLIHGLGMGLVCLGLGHLAGLLPKAAAMEAESEGADAQVPAAMNPGPATAVRPGFRAALTEESRDEAAVVAQWQGWLGRRAGALGRTNDEQILREAPSATCVLSRAGDLGMALMVARGGIRLSSLFDLGQMCELLTDNPPPLFVLGLRRNRTQEEGLLSADEGWHRVSALPSAGGFRLLWQSPKYAPLAGMLVTAEARPEAATSAWSWSLRVERVPPEWTLYQLTFPQMTLATLGNEGRVFLPRGPGEVHEAPWNGEVTYEGQYPGDGCSMQFLAAYRDAAPATGLYLGLHDPWGSSKALQVSSQADLHEVCLACEQPVPDAGQPGNGFDGPGSVVWRLLRGDWYDAARHYRDWAEREALWWPRAGEPRHPATPDWLRQLNAWGVEGESADAVSLEMSESPDVAGQPMRMALMRPAAEPGQDTFRGVVSGLFRETGVRAVCLEQVGAPAPVSSIDRSRGPPSGCGRSWNEAHRKMLDSIRARMPPDTALTTGGDAEPFLRWFDGCLTRDWQRDGQVPAFPAVYGGRIALLGRAYHAGPTRDLALRMKASQQLVFGEQIGGITPAVLGETGNAAFLEMIVQARDSVRRYFSEGEMARPPRLAGPLPRVRADWRGSGQEWVTTDAVLAGAWRLPTEKRLLMLFVNVSDEVIVSQLDWVPADEGILARRMSCDANEQTLTGNRRHLVARFAQPHTFPALSVQTWELRW